MRTYFESHIDYSEVKFVTTNKELLAYADGLMKQFNLSNGKKLNLKPVNRAVRPANFFKRLDHKLKNPSNNLTEVQTTLHFLYDKKDYYGAFFYILFLFGLNQMYAPLSFTLLPANPDYLKQYLSDFITQLDSYQNAKTEKAAVKAQQAAEKKDQVMAEPDAEENEIEIDAEPELIDDSL